MNDITVIVATIPPRAERLAQALSSVAMQTLQPSAIVVEYDHDRTGAAATKNRALAKVTTEWVAFCDDDDILLPHHLEALHNCMIDHGADVVYPWPQMAGAPEPRLRFGLPFDADELRRGNYIPTTSLVRTKLAQAAGGFQCPPGTQYDDWGLYLGLLDAGAHFVHLPERTWIWNVHNGNTAGVPTHW